MSGIRNVVKEDLEGLKKVLDSIDLFPSEMLDEMVSDYFNNPESEDIWFTKIENGRPVSIGYCVPEKLTDRTFNLYAIGVQRAIQGKGIGSEMMAFIENELKQKGKRILIVDTSGTDTYKLTRTFYENLGYTKEAIIRDFWGKGDDKVTYWKKLN